VQDTNETISDFQWLVDHATRWSEVFEDSDSPTQVLLKLLRRDLPEARAHLLLELKDLRQRARPKFRQAAKLFFTRKGLEQATEDSIAEYKAARFQRFEKVGDFCCGIGGDLMSLSKGRTFASGVDHHPISALLARENCRRTGVSPDVSAQPIDNHHLQAVSAWHIDPDRRTEPPDRSTDTPDRRTEPPDRSTDTPDRSTDTPDRSTDTPDRRTDPPDRRTDIKRTTNLMRSQPPVEQLQAWIRLNPNAVIKTAPANPGMGERWEEQCEREWISSRGECRQQVLWFGELTADPNIRRATRIYGNAVNDSESIAFETFTSQGVDETQFESRESAGRYVFDMDPAIRAGQLVACLAVARRLFGLGNNGSYLTGDAPISDPMLSAFEVLESMSLDERKIKRYLREHRIGRLELKQKGTKRNLDQLAASWAVHGDQSATLLLYRQGRGERALVARRVSLGC